MTTTTPFASPVKALVSRFFALCVAAMLIGAIAGVGLLDRFAAKRALGLFIGVLAIIVGNFLPKVRPLHGWLGNPAEARAAERFAGWILVLAGSADVALFGFAPLEPARRISAVLGISAILLVAVSWVWSAFRPVPQNQPSAGDLAPDLTGRSAANHELLAMLLLAFLWLFATASLTFLLAKKPWFQQFGALWVSSGFCLLYAGLRFLLGRKRPARTCLAPR